MASQVVSVEPGEGDERRVSHLHKLRGNVGQKSRKKFKRKQFGKENFVSLSNLVTKNWLSNLFEPFVQIVPIYFLYASSDQVTERCLPELMYTQNST